MFANHLVTIAPHAAVMVSPIDRDSKTGSFLTTSIHSSQDAKKRRAKSVDVSNNGSKKELAEIRVNRHERTARKSSS
ncbi:hypothetical protein GN244_ATG07684 [Phytophthora infestans]|uniref:Uncharacterized protein n=1 Tax=Phytophthora infestans TaxID=4787 RepID=A0A833W2S2_PHYIN|nr:hypothetical protein GN244_ATG07684 [Phytophthora infestans]